MEIKYKIFLSAFYLFYIIGIYCDDNIVKIRAIRGIENQKEFILNIDTSEDIQKTSFHFLLATIGRRSIFKMIESLRDQVSEEDIFTIVFDGKDRDNVFEEVKTVTSNFCCKVNVIYEKENYGYWGHKLRNEKYSDLEGDFVLHCDDDDIYMPNSIKIAKRICSDKNTLYMARISSPYFIIWDKPAIVEKNTTTQCGIIPAKLNKLGTWGYSYGGDYSFYKSLEDLCNHDNIVFIDLIIYHIIDPTPYKMS